MLVSPSEPFCSVRPVEPVVVPSFPVTIPLYFDTAPTCPSEFYDVTYGQWETSNPFAGCVDCFGVPPTSDYDAALTVFFPDQPEVCYYHTCSSSMYDLPDVQTSCCTTVSVSFPPCENAAVRCDFSTLTPGVPLTDEEQAQKLRDACYMTAQAYSTTSSELYPQGPPLNIFDSSDIKSNSPKHDPDLGAPNRACGGGDNLPSDEKGPGRGKGGIPWIKVNGTVLENPYKNCNPLGNLLIVQNENIDAFEANDSPNGGCMHFSFFGKSVTLNGIGLLDIEEGASISIQSTDFIIPPEDFPATGNNGYLDYRGSVPGPGAGISFDAMEICIPGSGAISYIDYNICKPLM